MNKNRKLINAFLVSTMMLSNVAPVALAANDASTDNVDTVVRLSGDTRVETSIGVSEYIYDSADTVVVAGYSGEVDALTGTVLASLKDAPLLLVSGKNGDIADVKAEIASLGAKNVVLLGDTNVISQSIQDDLAVLDLNVSRVAGSDRFDTAIEVAKQIGAKHEHVFLTNDGRSGQLADALAAGPVSGRDQDPILLTSQAGLPSQTIKALGAMDVSRVTIIGGEDAVSDVVKAELEDLGIEVSRVAGDNRWETAEAIAETYFPDSDKVIVANDGRVSYADALVGGYLGAKEHAPILLTLPGQLNTPTKNFLGSNASFAYILGGNKVVSQAAQAEVQEIVDGNNEDDVVVTEDLAVKSINAINASELEVKFGTAVKKSTAREKTNYQLKVNNENIDSKNIVDIQVAQNGKSATILLDQENLAFQNGDKYVVQTNDAIVAESGQALEKFVSNEMTFSQTAAPSLNSVALSGDDLVLTFDRPVDATGDKNLTLVKVDEVAIENEDLKPVSPKAENSDVLGTAGDYRYKIEIKDATANKEAKKLGSHEVVIFDVKDTASAYASVASVLTGKYTVTDDVTTPAVVAVEEVNANRFFVETNTAVELDEDSKVVVNKGTHEFPMNINEVVNNTSESYAVAGQHNGKNGIWVVVSDKKDSDENPLYRRGEATAKLTVTVEKYKANGLVGTKATKEITLHKNNTKPVVDSTLLRDDVLVVNFTHSIKRNEALVEATDFVVRDKDDIIIEGFGEATFNGSTISFANGKELKDTPYTVEFKANKFQNQEEDTFVRSYLVNTLKNDKIVASVGKELDTNFKYTEFDLGANLLADAEENILDIEYPTEMGDSARDVRNYRLDGKTLPRGTTADFVDGRDKVRIVFPENTFKTNTKYKLGVTKDVKTQAGSIIVGSLQTKAPAEATFDAFDNIKPALESAVFYVNTEDVDNKTTTNQIEVTFDEAVKLVNGEVEKNFVIKIAGSEFEVDAVEAVTTGKDKDHKLVLTLNDTINVNQNATVEIALADETDEESVFVEDLSDNIAEVGSKAVAKDTKFRLDAQTPDTDTAVANVEALIAALSAESAVGDIRKAREAYDELTPAQQALVTNIEKLDNLEVEKENEVFVEANYVEGIILNSVQVRVENAKLEDITEVKVDGKPVSFGPHNSGEYIVMQVKDDQVQEVTVTIDGQEYTASISK